MAIVKKEIQIGDQPTHDALKEVLEAQKHEIIYDEDSPELSPAQIAEFVPANPQFYKPKKQQITLKLDADIIEAFKKTGKGYQTRMNAALRNFLLSGMTV